ncbi:UTP--glucose-1-phosphate uridylyltransferase [Candidatus Woesearchaeota archaeon CG10_big_fil_rev_8_21_14_0_10_37_12]|nr:MAG: UTP--glucose-1-phosphate uridylyltransferase [Candidatus Woesearchaeota archaeon CG10_big_fil_rev_8_21_14_0_10_37_12]
MQAVILAGGKGTRLLSLTENIPKALVDVNGKSVLEHILDESQGAGVKEVVIVVNHLKEKIIEQIGAAYKGMSVRYAVQESLKGDADALKCADPYISDDNFFVIACDSLFRGDHLKKISERNSDGVMTVYRAKHPENHGVILHDGQYIQRIFEKSSEPPSNLANNSIYYFPRAIFDACNRISPGHKGEFKIVDAIQLLIDEGKQFTFEEIAEYYDVGTLDSLAYARAHWN